MDKSRDILKWLKEMLGIEKPRTPHPRSIVERLEGLIPPVEEICTSYKVDQSVAKEIHKHMLAIEERIWKTLKDQQEVVAAQELFIEQQDITAGIIDIQVNKQLNAETIIRNFRIFLTEDEVTIHWILKHIINPAIFAAGFGRLDASRQRALFNALGATINDLQRTDSGMLVEPGATDPAPKSPRGTGKAL